MLRCTASFPGLRRGRLPAAYVEVGLIPQALCALPLAAFYKVVPELAICVFLRKHHVCSYEFIESRNSWFVCVFLILPMMNSIASTGFIS
jgi:hypothetical protein